MKQETSQLLIILVPTLSAIAWLMWENHKKEERLEIVEHDLALLILMFKRAAKVSVKMQDVATAVEKAINEEDENE